MSPQTGRSWEVGPYRGNPDELVESDDDDPEDDMESETDEPDEERPLDIFRKGDGSYK